MSETRMSISVHLASDRFGRDIGQRWIRRSLLDGMCAAALMILLTACQGDLLLSQPHIPLPESIRIIEQDWLDERLGPLDVSLELRMLRMRTNARHNLLVVWESSGDPITDNGEWSTKRYVVPVDESIPAWMISESGWIGDEGRIVLRQSGRIIENAAGQRLDLSEMGEPSVHVDDAGRFLCVYDDVAKHAVVYGLNDLDRPLGAFISAAPPMALYYHYHRDRLLVYSESRHTPHYGGEMYTLRLFQIEKNALVEGWPVYIPYSGQLMDIDPQSHTVLVHRPKGLYSASDRFLLRFSPHRLSNLLVARLHPSEGMFLFFVPKQ